MIRKTFLPVLFIGFCFLHQSCSKLISPVYPIPEYTGSLLWEEINTESIWSERWDHSAVKYQNKIWIFGGYNPGNTSSDSYFEDVWSSSDGKSWDLLTSEAPWLGRRGHATVVFDNGDGESIYLIGGYSVDEESGYRQYCNDVWKSADGINWSQIKTNSIPAMDSDTDWYPRFNHCCDVVSQDGKPYILLIAGATIEKGSPAHHGMIYFSDVWKSENGIEWSKMETQEFGIRAEHSTSVNPENGRIYMQGGSYGSHDEGDNHLDKPVSQWQKLWSSQDGIHWTAENDVAGFPQAYLYRAQHKILHYGGYLWGFPGKSSNSVLYSKNPDTYAICKIDESGSWTVDSEGPPFIPTYGYAAVVFQDKIWVLGGHTASHGPSNQVWAGQE